MTTNLLLPIVAFYLGGTMPSALAATLASRAIAKIAVRIETTPSVAFAVFVIGWPIMLAFGVLRLLEGRQPSSYASPEARADAALVEARRLHDRAHAEAMATKEAVDHLIAMLNDPAVLPNSEAMRAEIASTMITLVALPARNVLRDVLSARTAVEHAQARDRAEVIAADLSQMIDGVEADDPVEPPATAVDVRL